MSIRQIDGLKWSRHLGARPSCIPIPKPRGSQAAGLRYERNLAKSLPTALHGCWFEFEDANGHGYCCPDLILPQNRQSSLVILEAKLSFTMTAVPQLWGYLEVVSRAFNKTTFGVVVTKYLRNVPDYFYIAASLEDAVVFAQRRPTVLHWLGAAATLKMAA